MSKPIAMQVVKRAPDVNGNIAKLLLIYSPVGHTTDIITLDYGNIPGDLRDVLRLPDMTLTNKDFRGWVDLQREKGLTADIRSVK